MWARQLCRISPPRFLADVSYEATKPEASFVLLCFALFAFSGLCFVFVVCLFLICRLSFIFPALNLSNITSYPLPYSDITSSIKKHLFTRWQHLWHNSTSNKLHNIYPTLPINSNYPKAQLTRQEQTLYNRLRIGHTYLTHSYLLKDEDPPICIPCNSLLTVEHILISCID